jgi:hypothetical protein
MKAKNSISHLDHVGGHLRKEPVMKAIKLSLYCILLLGSLWVGRDNSPSDPEGDAQNGGAAHRYTSEDFHPEGDVVETSGGYAVKGELHVDTEEGQTSFLNADLKVEFDEIGSYNMPCNNELCRRLALVRIVWYGG